MKKLSIFLCALLLPFAMIGIANASTTLDVYDWDLSQLTPIGQIDTIATNQTGAQHYDYYSASAHPSGVNLGYYNSNFWVHENTGNGELTFGFVFGLDNGPNDENNAELYFRIVDSTTDVYVSQSDDPGEAQEISPGWFEGDYWYNQNTDGVAVSGINGTGWTIMIDSVNFGDVTNWYAASGQLTDFTDDLSLIIGHEYRIVPEGETPSGSPVNPSVPEPATMLLFGSGLAGLFGFRRTFIKK